MVDKNTFMETLRAVKEIAGASPEPMDRETALSYFKDMELTPQQEELVYQFLMEAPEQETENLEETPEQEAGAGRETDSEFDGQTEWKSFDRDNRKKENSASPAADTIDSSHFQMYLEEISEIAELKQ